jgi:hypothetical protein
LTAYTPSLSFFRASVAGYGAADFIRTLIKDTELISRKIITSTSLNTETGKQSEFSGNFQNYFLYFFLLRVGYTFTILGLVGFFKMALFLGRHFEE